MPLEVTIEADKDTNITRVKIPVRALTKDSLQTIDIAAFTAYFLSQKAREDQIGEKENEEKQDAAGGDKGDDDGGDDDEEDSDNDEGYSLPRHLPGNGPEVEAKTGEKRKLEGTTVPAKKLRMDGAAETRQEVKTINATADENYGPHPEPLPTMEIFVKLYDGRTATYRVRSSDKIGSLKKEICYRMGYTQDDQRLIWAGKQLENERTFADYKIENQSTIHTVARLRGS